MFLKALNALVEAKEETIENLQELIETVCQIDSLGAEQERLKQELRIIAENLANLIRENSSVALNQTEQAEKEKKLRILHEEKHRRWPQNYSTSGKNSIRTDKRPQYLHDFSSQIAITS